MSDDREQRNAVFQGANAPDPRTPSISTSDKLKADFGLDIPVELVPLPSAGKVYAPGTPLACAETVEISSMTAREEDILTSRALLKKGTVVTELIRSCLINKAINPIDLLTGDRNSLMLAIRITGYGQDYDAEVECSECEVKSSQVFNLADLAIRRLSIEPVQPGMNLFEFQLPYTKKIVRFSFMTGRVEQEISLIEQKSKKVGLNNETSVTTNIHHSLVSVDGIEDRAKIAQFVRAMPARDSLALRTYMKNNEPDIIMKQFVTCSSCGAEEEVQMPIGVNFLWPNAGR